MQPTILTTAEFECSVPMKVPTYIGSSRRAGTPVQFLVRITMISQMRPTLLVALCLACGSAWAPSGIKMLQPSRNE